MNKTLVQQEFGKTAASYLTSKPHAQGESLERLVALTSPQPDWTMLDIATGGGHVAYRFAPHVARIWATDITDEMLSLVREESAKRGQANIRTAYAKAEALPFEDGRFDLVTCRIAPHHFDSIARFLDESRRVMKPAGVFVVVDNIVPAGTVGDYINAFERFRDPSHLRAWTLQEWRDTLARHGFSVTHEETLDKKMDFNAWAARHDATMRSLLRAMLVETTPDVAATLRPDLSADNATFWLREGLFVARKAGA